MTRRGALRQVGRKLLGAPGLLKAHKAKNKESGLAQGGNSKQTCELLPLHS